MKELDLQELVMLRKDLHRNPELSGGERNTSEKIKNFVKRFNPDKVLSDIAGNGIAFIFKGKESGKTILFRCELDALPIREQNEFEYKSSEENISHKCGHDGHMAILSGLASLYKYSKPEKGNVVLLFQPAEETGAGANEVLKDEKFKAVQPDYVFALHNLPGFPVNSIVLSTGIFACASKGMIIRLYGKTSHASQPERGLSPAPAAAAIIQNLPLIPDKILDENSFGLATVIHARIGDVAFGTSPGYAEIMLTLRAFEDEDLEKISATCEDIVREEAGKYGLKFSIEWTEEFPSSVNYDECVELIKSCSDKLNLQSVSIKEPFRWSEDFGHFLKKYKGALFGVGAGVNHPDLHNPDYDFPDEIISTSAELFECLVKEINGF